MKYGLLGERLSHSYSCELHRLLGSVPYELCERKPEELPSFFREKNFAGINVTIPYKEAILPFLDNISERAREIGAVNTIVNREGKLFGYNTDFAGMRALLQKIGVSLSGKKVMVLGSGGTSKTARAVAESLGAASVVTVSRQGKNGVSYEEAVRAHRDVQILLNTTPVGMVPRVEGQAISLAPFPKLEAVADAVYNPLRTDLVLEAEARGIPAEGGLYMLTSQAVYASALFRGMEAKPDDIDRIYRILRDQKRNIVLIGMPSCGKTSVGQLLSQKTGMAFLDSDDRVRERIGMNIAEFFARYGEEAFRNVESEILSEISLTSGSILATGGGAVLRQENVRALKRNGVLVFLDRSPENLIATDDRPLSADRESLLSLYHKRYETYLSAADLRIPADSSLTETAESVWKEVRK